MQDGQMASASPALFISFPFPGLK